MWERVNWFWASQIQINVYYNEYLSLLSKFSVTKVAIAQCINRQSSDLNLSWNFSTWTDSKISEFETPQCGSNLTNSVHRLNIQLLVHFANERFQKTLMKVLWYFSNRRFKEKMKVRQPVAVRHHLMYPKLSGISRWEMYPAKFGAG